MDQIKIYAPVVIPTLCRYDHFKRCIESLSKCTHAAQTEVFIALDYPSKKEHKEGWKLISNYLDNCKLNFRKLIVIRRKQNYGVSKNIYSLRKFVFEKYDCLIFSEDDNEFSLNFLDYINKGLDFYKDDNRIMAISGYNYPVRIENSRNNVYLNTKFSAWGCGLWKEKYALLENAKSEEFCKKILSSPFVTFKFIIKRPSILTSLISNMKKNIFLGDGCYEAYLIYNNKFSVFPVISKVRNRGHDGSGINCGDMEDDIYETQEIDLNSLFHFTSLKLSRDKKIERKVFNFVVNGNFKLYLKDVVKYLQFIFVKK